MGNTPPNPYTTTRPNQSQSQLPPQGTQRMWNWSDFILITLIIIITFFLGYSIASSFLLGPNQENINSIVNTLAFENLFLIIEVFALIGCVYFLGLKRKRISLETFGLRYPSKNWLFIALGVGIVGALLELLISLYGPALLNDTVAAQNDLIGTTGVTWSGIIVMGVVTILGIPLAEEMYFRGVLYTFLRERLGIWTAAVISILLYAIIGGDIVSILANAVLGIAATFVYERSKSLWAAILVNAIINLMFFIAYLVTTPLAKIPFF